MFMSGSSSGYEHFTKAFHSKADEVFENPYTSDHELIVRNHPMMVMAEHSQRVSIICSKVFFSNMFSHFLESVTPPSLLGSCQRKMDELWKTIILFPSSDVHGIPVISYNLYLDKSKSCHSSTVL